MTTVLPPVEPGSDDPAASSRGRGGVTGNSWLRYGAVFVVGVVVGGSVMTALLLGSSEHWATRGVVATPAVSAPAPAAGPTEPAGAPVNQVGGTFRNLGATVTVQSVQEASSLELNESSYRPGSGYESYTATAAGPGAKYVVVRTEVTNDSTTSFDLTCSLPISTKILDARGRQFDAIDSLYKLRDNPECNDGLQPGFTADMTWAYRLPSDAVVSGWSFEETTDFTGTGRPTVLAVQVGR